MAQNISSLKSSKWPLDIFEEADVVVNSSAPKSPEQLLDELNEITALYNVGVVLNSTLNPKEIIWNLYKETSRLIDTSNFALAIFNEPQRTLQYMVIVQQGKQQKPVAVKLTTPLGLTGTVLKNQMPLQIDDLTTVNQPFELNRFYMDKNIRSWLGVPIINPALANDIPQGVLVLWSETPQYFNSRHLWLLSSLGTQASIALRNATHFESSQRRAAEMSRLKDVAQRQAEEMKFLNDVSRTLSSTLNLDKVLTTIMEQVDDMLAVEAGSLLLTEPTTGDLIFQIALGNKAKEIKPFRVPKGEGIAGRVAQTGKPLVISDAQNDERHFKLLDQRTHFNTRNMLCVPLMRHEQIIGVLQVLNKKVGDFTTRDIDLLTSIASFAAIAIENARLYETLETEHQRTIAAEQEARKKLATDLHDGPTQLVAAIMMNIDFATKALQKDPSLLPKTFDEMHELADRASHQMRTLLFELRPLVLEKQGLGTALQVFLERRQKDIVEDANTKLSLEIDTQDPGGDVNRHDGTTETAIFSIVQETVNNAIKHAKANNITVKLSETEAGFETQIVDDGVGFDVKEVMASYETRGSLGMVNIRERAESLGGEFSIKSEKNIGTVISIFVPNEKAEKQRRIKKRAITGMLSLPPSMPQ